MFRLHKIGRWLARRQQPSPACGRDVPHELAGMAVAALELDEDARRALYQRANEILVDELPMIQVATDPRTWVWSNKVHDVQIDLVGNITLYETWLA